LLPFLLVFLLLLLLLLLSRTELLPSGRPRRGHANANCCTPGRPKEGHAPQAQGLRRNTSPTTGPPAFGRTSQAAGATPPQAAKAELHTHPGKGESDKDKAKIARKSEN